MADQLKLQAINFILKDLHGPELEQVMLSLATQIDSAESLHKITETMWKNMYEAAPKQKVFMGLIRNNSHCQPNNMGSYRCLINRGILVRICSCSDGYSVRLDTKIRSDPDLHAFLTAEDLDK